MLSKVRIGALFAGGQLSKPQQPTSTSSVLGRVGGGHPASLCPLPLAANCGFRRGTQGGRRGLDAGWDDGTGRRLLGKARGPGRQREGRGQGAQQLLFLRAGAAYAQTGLALPAPACANVSSASEPRGAASFADEGGGNSARLLGSPGSTLPVTREDPR